MLILSKPFRPVKTKMGVNVAMYGQLARRGGSGFKFGAFVLLLSLSLIGFPTAKAATFEESQIKAAFLFHFFDFIKWPNLPTEETNQSMVFCALDEGPVEHALRELLLAPQARNSTIQFKLISDPSETSACNYLFISSANKHLISRFIENTFGKAILTVSDSEGFALQGGMIELVRKGTRVRVLINIQNVTNHGLKVSSKLLRLATIIPVTDRGNDE